MQLNRIEHFAQTRAGLSIPERAGVLAGTASVGRTFSRGLLPRASVDQAFVTGASAAINYATTTLSESLIESAANKIAGSQPDAQSRNTAYLGAALAGDLVAIGIGAAAQKVLAQRKDERIARAWVRTAMWRVAVGGLAGAIVRSGEAVLAGVDRGRGGPISMVPFSVTTGVAIAAVQYARLRRAMADAGVEADAEGVRLDENVVVVSGRSLAIGAGVTAGLLVMARGERALAGAAGAGVTKLWPAGAPVARPIGHLAAMGLIGAAAAQAGQVVFRRAEHTGDAVEAAYTEAPTSDFVSGGPRSAVRFEDLGREGRRFVNMALTTDEITEVMGGKPIDPIRVFVGLESAATTSERADLAMQDLEAMGAFERSVILFMSPTGTGYLNYVAAESLEYLTGGDVALVAMQYSLRPSPLSLGRVGIGVEQNSALLHALKWRLQAIPKKRRPRLCVFGESLGAHTSQDVFADEGVAGFHRSGVDRALFLGTPYACRWRERWISAPEAVDPGGEVLEVDSYEEWLATSEDRRERARYFMLTHHKDPMPKFWFPLAVQRPLWMGPPETREPGLPLETVWRPYTTFLITFIDVKNAMHVVPGIFEAWGHDYRKDLARFTSLAYDLPVDDERLERMERALRARELQWARRRVVDEQLAGAEQAIQQRLQQWGVPADRIGSVIAAAEPAVVDEYAAPGA